MKIAYKWQHPMNFVGTYPDNWAGYVFLQWSSMSGNWHEGVDYNGPGGCDSDTGMALFACANGEVEWIGYHNGWGHHMYIKHEDPELGIIYSHYAHCLGDSFTVKEGDEITVGQKIAEVGDSGWNDMCAHVHFEIRYPIGQGYDFWANPANGWNDEKVAEFYFDPFLFIEERKDREGEQMELKDTEIDWYDYEGKTHTVGWYVHEWEVEKKNAEKFAEDIATKDDDYERLQKTLAETNLQISALNLEVKDLKKERDDLKDEVKIAEEDINELEGKIEGLEGELKTAREEKEELALEFAECKKKIRIKLCKFSWWEFIKSKLGRCQ
jgi:hypothetical protein